MEEKATRVAQKISFYVNVQPVQKREKIRLSCLPSFLYMGHSRFLQRSQYSGRRIVQTTGGKLIKANVKAQFCGIGISLCIDFFHQLFKATDLTEKNKASESKMIDNKNIFPKNPLEKETGEIYEDLLKNCLFFINHKQN